MNVNVWSEIYHASNVLMVLIAGWQLWKSKLPQQRIGLLLLLKSVGALAILHVLAIGPVHEWWLIRTSNSFTFLAFYVDWLWTTTISLVILWLMATKNQPSSVFESSILLSKLIYANLTMLTLGMFAERASGSLRWVLVISAICIMVYILTLIWGPLKRLAYIQSQTVYPTLFATCLFISVAWLVFPILWMLGPFGLSVFTSEQTSESVMIAHTITKVGFFCCVWLGWRRMEDHTE